MVMVMVTLARSHETAEETNVTESSQLESLPSPSARTVEWTEGPLCPLWGPMDSFYEEGIEKGRYLGRWWLQDKYTDLTDVTGKCWSQVYTVNYRDQTVHRLTEHQSIIGGRLRSDSGEITLEDISDANLLKFTPESGSVPELEYRVLATDYETFTIEYTCQDNSLIKRKEQVWIYTRDKKPGKTVLKRAYKSLKILGLNGWKLKKADQSCSGSKETNTIGSIRRNYEVASSRGALDRHRGPSGHKVNKKYPGSSGSDGRTAALDYDYDNNYRSQLRHRSSSGPITTGELTSRMLGTGLKIAQSVLAPWTLHPVMGFERKFSPEVNQAPRRRSGVHFQKRKRSRRRKYRE